MPVHSLNSSK